MKLDGFHLPGIPAPKTTTWAYPAPDDGVALELRMAQLTPAELTEQIEALRAHAVGLAERPVPSIVHSIDRVARRLLDVGDVARRSAVAAISRVTGSSAPMCEHVLDGMAQGWREASLLALLRSEFGTPELLDDFVDRMGTGIRSRAFGPEVSVHSFSGNIPGVGVTSLIRTLLLKSASLGKSARGEPVLTPLFARTLAEVDPELGQCVAVTYWPGGDPSLEPVALQEADAVIAYGSTEAINALRSRTPASIPFLAYPSRLSFGVLTREALSRQDAAGFAEAAALAVSTFDQHGCVSPHLFYVEEGGDISVERWSGLLAEAMERQSRILPRGTLAPAEVAAIRQARGEAEFAQLAAAGTRLYASSDTAWTVIFDPDPSFIPSCLNRLVRVKPVVQIEEVVSQLRPLAPVLQSVGVAGSQQRLAPLISALGRLGASRITALERLPWPAAEWHHDGRPVLGDLVRWCDWGEGV